MSERQFISLLRDLAAQSRRKRRSFSAQVVRAVNRYVEDATQIGGTPEDYANVRAWAEQVAMREYGREDASLSFDSDG